MVWLKHCCCCFSLRTGGIVVGWIDAILNSIFWIIRFILVFYPYVFVPKTDTRIAADGVHNVLNNWNTRTELYETEKEQWRSLYNFFGIVGLVVSTLSIISDAFLILGSIKGNRYMLLSWLNMKILGIVSSARGIYAVASVSIKLGVVILIVVCFSLYLWICILSLYQEIAQQETRRQELFVMETITNTENIYPQPTVYDKSSGQNFV